MIDQIINVVEHYWTDHKKAVIAIGVVLVIAYIL
jgi:hypothetical protein